MTERTMAAQDVPATPWTITANEDRWDLPATFATREEAVAAAPAALGLAPDQKFWTGFTMPAGAVMPDADRVIEDMFENARDENGDHAENWLDDVPAEAMLELQKGLEDLVLAWLDKHNLLPDWYDIEQIEEHHAPREKQEISGDDVGSVEDVLGDLGEPEGER